MMDIIEVWVCRWLIRRLLKGYGAECGSKQEGCMSCQSAETVKFLKEHIKVIKY